MEYALYIASLLGAIALYMMMPRAGHTPRAIGLLLGAMTLGGLWLYLARFFAAPEAMATGTSESGEAGRGSAPIAYYYVFSALAIGSAVGVICHPKPVYSALWFVMVVLASAGLFLSLEAEFMAMAMVIIYGGAILVTYVFVIMLASQSADPNDSGSTPIYDRAAREPIAAVAVGFLLLALLLNVTFASLERRAPSAPAADDVVQRMLARRPAHQFAAELALSASAGAMPSHPVHDRLTNTEAIGLDLFRRHPLGLELAGVILLVALIGAVVIARMPIPETAASATTSPQET